MRARGACIDWVLVDNEQPEIVYQTSCVYGSGYGAGGRGGQRRRIAVAHVQSTALGASTVIAAKHTRDTGAVGNR